MIAAISLWELFVLHEALAGQPLEKVAAALNHQPNVNHQPNAGRPAPTVQAPSGRLDLRPPSEIVAGTDATDSSVRSERPASARPKQFEVTPAAASSRTVETMAQSFRQQGLPVARLFENKDSLVHLGLNQKGKPGLWIVHKLH
jgi:hypothetical protein